MYLILSIPGGADRLFPRPAIRNSMHNDNSPNYKYAAHPRGRPAAALPQLPRRPRPEPLHRRLDQTAAALLHGRAVAAAPAAAALRR